MKASTNTQTRNSISPLWILSYERTGSTFLQDMLNATGLFKPRIDEWFHPDARGAVGLYPDIKYWAPDAVTRYVVTNPPKFAKVQAVHATQANPPLTREGVEEKLPGIKYVVIMREDMIASAISLYFARETGMFGIVNPSQLDVFRSIPIEFDDSKVLDAYGRIKQSRNYWAQWLADADRLIYDYQDIVSRPKEIAKEILNHAGVDYDGDISLPPLCKQTRPETEDFKRRLSKLLIRQEKEAKQHQHERRQKKFFVKARSSSGSKCR